MQKIPDLLNMFYSYHEIQIFSTAVFESIEALLFFTLFLHVTFGLETNTEHTYNNKHNKKWNHPRMYEGNVCRVKRKGMKLFGRWIKKMNKNKNRRKH